MGGPGLFGVSNGFGGGIFLQGCDGIISFFTLMCIRGLFYLLGTIDTIYSIVRWFFICSRIILQHAARRAMAAALLLPENSEQCYLYIIFSSPIPNRHHPQQPSGYRAVLMGVPLHLFLGSASIVKCWRPKDCENSQKGCEISSPIM